MKYLHPLLLAAAVLAVSIAARAEGPATRLDKGFVPDNGRINLGVDNPMPSTAKDIKIPTPEESLAAKMTPISKQPSAGEGAATTGAANADTGTANASGEPPPSGPIGSFGQTIPSKFSKRNDVLDRTPTMAVPLPLSAEERKQIFQAVMADKTPAAAGAETLKPAGQLTTAQALDGMHPLPGSVGNIEVVKGLKYVKAKDRVLLVAPATRIVVDQIVS